MNLSSRARDFMPEPMVATQKTPDEAGSVLLVCMVVLVGLLALAIVTVAKVRRGMQSSTQSRSSAVALAAAESGIGAGMDFLESNVSPTAFFTAFVSPGNASVQSPPGIAGNGIAAGQSGNLFSGDIKMNYAVSILNNEDDPGFAAGSDSDGIVILRAVGRGPGTSMVVVESTIDGSASPLVVLNWRVVD